MRTSVAFLLALTGTFVTAFQRQQHESIVHCLAAASVPQDIPGTANFTRDIVPYNLRLPFTPVALAIPSTVAQVQAAVSCAASFDVTVSPRSGGHSYASHDLGGEDGHLVIDLKLFNTISVDSTTNVATIGPGARLGNVALGLFNQGGRAISHGVCPGVGMGGHVLHGGYGLASHTYGLALDFMTEATVVLADSRVVKVSTAEQSELFWALRGAGCSFGIVTEMKFRTIPAPPENFLFYYIYTWNTTQALAGFQALQNYANSPLQPAEMNMRVVIGSLGPTMVWIVEGVYHGSEADFQAAIEPLLAELGPTYLKTNGTFGWIDSLLYANNNQLLPGGGTGEQLETPLDYHANATFFAKSLLTEWITPTEIEAFLNYLYQVGPVHPNPWYIIMTLVGGPTSTIASVPHDSTAYAHRSALLTFELFDQVVSGAYPNTGFAFLDGFVEALASGRDADPRRMYYNYADPTLSERDAHLFYWRGHYERLVRVKREFDPRRVFSNPQAVLS